MSVSIDDFLKAVYQERCEEGNTVSGSLLASRLNVSAAAVTDMARKLAVKGLVEYKPYKEVELTKKGTTHALQIIRRHRLWELFLYSVLNMDLSDVHQEAELLEHQASDSLMDKIAEFLDNPVFDPHGEPIPHKNGVLPEVGGLLQLEEVPLKVKVEVLRIRIRDREIFEMFKHYGIKPGVKLSVLKKFDFDRSIEIEIENRKVLLSNDLSARIFCKTPED
jgi:DtxR family transcriptional regulator, Mn-dependent transcriptional regulator